MSAPEPSPELPAAVGDETETLRAMWSSLLAVDAVGDESDFFELGGHSMLAARLTSRASRELGRDVPRELIFNRPRFADWASAAVSGAHQDTSQDTSEDVPAGIGAGALEGEASLQQQELLAVEHLLGRSPANNLTVVTELGEPVPADELRRALEWVVARHPALRAAFRPDSFDVGTLPAVEVPFEVAEAADERSARRLIAARALDGVDISSGPILRAQLIRRADAADLLALHLHHAVADGASALIILEDLDAFVAGRRPDPPGFTYLDYARWQSAQRAGLLAASGPHWQQVVQRLALAGAGLDRQDEGVTRLARLRGELSADVIAGVRRRFAGQGATDFAVVVLAVARGLSECFGRDTIGVGLLLDNRRPEFEDVVGPFASSSLIAVTAGGNSDDEVLRTVSRDIDSARQWSDLPLPVAVAPAAARVGVDSMDDLVDVIVTVEHEERSIGTGRLGLRPVLDVDQPIAGLALNAAPTLLMVVGCDGSARLAVDHRATPAATSAARELLDGTLRVLTRLAAVG